MGKQQLYHINVNIASKMPPMRFLYPTVIRQIFYWMICMYVVHLLVFVNLHALLMTGMDAGRSCWWVFLMVK